MIFESVRGTRGIFQIEIDDDSRLARMLQVVPNRWTGIVFNYALLTRAEKKRQWRYLCGISNASRYPRSYCSQENTPEQQVLSDLGISEMYFTGCHLFLRTEPDLVLARLYYGSDMDFIYDVVEEVVLRKSEPT